jgi:hypothetical protein
MKKISVTIAVLAALSLGACSTLNIGGQVTLNTIEGIESSYGLLLNAENTYKALPLCLTGTVPSLTNICAKRSIIVRLQAADKIANQAVNSLEAFVKANPTVAPTQYISTAQAALSALQTVLNTASATGN